MFNQILILYDSSCILQILFQIEGIHDLHFRCDKIYMDNTSYIFHSAFNNHVYNVGSQLMLIYCIKRKPIATMVILVANYRYINLRLGEIVKGNGNRRHLHHSTLECYGDI